VSLWERAAVLPITVPLRLISYLATPDRNRRTRSTKGRSDARDRGRGQPPASSERRHRRRPWWRSATLEYAEETLFRIALTL